MMKENRAVYDCAFKFNDPELENVIFIGQLMMDSKVVTMKLPIQHPFDKTTRTMVFAGASTRRQGLYKYNEATKNGQILGG